mmetsp:Transcript_46432/g.110642  ORF Transcript_46432/g.110642 Transcript_46432/m.110642 type:complete len:491 (-) Transcript_46432:442-1914(-)
MPAMKKQKVVVMVDPYSSGMYMLQELQSQQWPIIGIQSSQDLASFWLAQYDPKLFVHNIQHNSLSKTLEELEPFDVAAVLAGSEPGVMLAEDLADSLGLPCNGAATKEWRRNKYAQQERLRECGIRAIEQLYSGDIDEILAWRQNWGQWPVIVKPAMSGGTDGVYWCHCDEDIRLAHSLHCGKVNVNGELNDKLLVQEYLDGPEYIVDSVSHQGQHVVSGVWVYKKTKDTQTKAIAYEYARLIESTGEEQSQLISYVWKCLDALDLKYGPAHSEVILTPKGPCLVETGARMHGAKGPKLIELATGLGTHELAVDVAVNGARVHQDLYSKNYRYTLKKFAFETVLRNDHAVGALAKPIDVPEMRCLHTVVDVFPSVKVGEEITITRDLATAPGFVMQLHPSLDAIFRDLARIRELEAGPLYQVLPKDSGNLPSPRSMPASFMVMSPKSSAERARMQGSKCEPKRMDRQLSEDCFGELTFLMEGLEDPNQDL